MRSDPELTQGPILVGIDFSQLSKSILEYAIKLAQQEMRPLHFVYVMPIVTDDSPDLLRIQELELEEYVHVAREKLHGSGIQVEGTLVFGTPAHEITRLADQIHAACIIVGTEEKSGLERLLLGSVAEAVIRKSDHPVIVVGPVAAAMAQHTLPWTNLMLACDTAEGVTDAARLAGEIASGHHARLTIFTVREEGIASPSEGQFDALEAMMSREAWLAVKPQCLIREGEPAQEIIRMAEDSQADLLVMSVHRGGELLSHLRPGLMARVLRLARCPAMILRDVHAPHHLHAVHLARPRTALV
jgi:nucleotide-binding universal stress UspA family protein